MRGGRRTLSRVAFAVHFLASLSVYINSWRGAQCAGAGRRRVGVGARGAGRGDAAGGAARAAVSPRVAAVRCRGWLEHRTQSGALAEVARAPHAKRRAAGVAARLCLHACSMCTCRIYMRGVDLLLAGDTQTSLDTLRSAPRLTR